MSLQHYIYNIFWQNITKIYVYFFVVTYLGKVTTLKILTQKYGILECHYNTIYIIFFLTKYYKNICILFCSDFFVVTYLGKVTTLKILTQKYGILECHYNTIYIIFFWQNITNIYTYILFCSDFFVVTYLGKVTTLKILTQKYGILECHYYTIYKIFFWQNITKIYVYFFVVTFL